jgi:hypothetical protein
MFIWPKPPCLRGVLTHAKWEKWLSVEAAITAVLIFLNSSTRSEKAMISVGQTKVLLTARLVQIEGGFRYLQVQGVEKQDHVLAFVVLQTDFFELAVDDGGALEHRCRFLQTWNGHLEKLLEPNDTRVTLFNSYGHNAL